jgi:UDP-N-acetyl-D-glucosamine dehydrogenase
VHDPHLSEVEVEGVTYKSADLTDDLLAAADLTVILTDHSTIDWQRVVSVSQRVFDTRNATRDVKKGRDKVRKL